MAKAKKQSRSSGLRESFQKSKAMVRHLAKAQLEMIKDVASEVAAGKRKAAAARKGPKKPAPRAPSYIGESKDRRTVADRQKRKALPGPKVRQAMKTTSARKKPRSPRGKYDF